MRVVVAEGILSVGENEVRTLTFDATELQVILFEAMVEMERPPDQSVDAALAEIRERDPMTALGLQRMARATMAYIDDVMQNATVEQVQ